MANLLNGFINTNGIADIYNKFIKVTSKLHKTSSSIGFIKKALHHNVTPTFAKIRGQFVHNKDQLDAERKIVVIFISPIFYLPFLTHFPIFSLLGRAQLIESKQRYYIDTSVIMSDSTPKDTRSKPI